MSHPVRLNLRQKCSLSKPPQPTLVSCLGEDERLLPIFTELVNVQRPNSFAIHVVPQLHTSSFAWRPIRGKIWFSVVKDIYRYIIQLLYIYERQYINRNIWKSEVGHIGKTFLLFTPVKFEFVFCESINGTIYGLDWTYKPRTVWQWRTMSADSYIMIKPLVLDPIVVKEFHFIKPEELNPAFM